MRIRQIRFDGWGSLSGSLTLDPDRLALLVVDTDRERNDLVSALEALMSGEPTARRGEPGRLEAEMELDPRETGAQYAQDGGARLCWRNLGKQAPPAPTPGASTRLEVLAGRRANPWLIDGEELAGYNDLADLVSWVRVWVDSSAGYRSAEDVRMVLNSGLIAYPGMLVDSGTVAEELLRLEHALERIASESGGLEEDRRQAAVSLAALDKVRKQIHAVETPLVALERLETRVRHAQLTGQLEAHRKAHGRLKTLRKEAMSLHDMATFPAPHAVDGMEKLLGTWLDGRARMEQLDENIADLRAALDRCTSAARRRGWAAGAFPAVAKQVELLVARYQSVTEKLAVQQAICDTELTRAEGGGSVAEFAQLDARVREVPDADRAFVTESFPSVLDQFVKFVNMGNGLRVSEDRLGTVRSLQVRIHVAAFLLIGFGLAAAVGVPAAQWNEPEFTVPPVLIAGGGFLFCLGSGLWFSAGGILQKRRGVLESQVTGLQMPIELEGLRLSVIELKMEEITRKFGYDSGEDMARDLVRHGQLAARPLTRAWSAAQEEMRRVRASEVEPLAAEAASLLRSYAFPRPEGNDPLGAVVQVWNELRTWSAGVALGKRLTDSLEKTLAERAALEPAQVERLASLRAQLTEAGVKADPATHHSAALVELRTRRRLYERWVSVRTREIPRGRALLMKPAELARTRREIRVVSSALGLDGAGQPLDRALTPEESQLARKLTVARRRLALLRDRERMLTAEARTRLTSYHRRLPALLERRRRLRAAKDRALLFQRAIETALSELEAVTTGVRPEIAKLLNAEAIPRWLRFRPALEGVRFEPDLALSLPHGSARQNPYDARLAHLAVRAALAGRSGANGLGCPLVLVEPFEKAGPAELGSFVNFLVTQLCPLPQVIIVTRRRSRYEKVRWEQPLVFKKIQIIEVRP